MTMRPDTIKRLEDRDARALTQAMKILPPSLSPALAEGTEGMYQIYTTSDDYIVDIRAMRCECDDFRYRKPERGCKHLRRVMYATGRWPIPKWVNQQYIDSGFGDLVETVDPDQQADRVTINAEVQVNTGVETGASPDASV